MNITTDAERLFHHLFRDIEGGGTIALFSGEWDHARGRLTRINDSQRATYPQAVGFAADWLAAEARAGREAYACVNLIIGKRRIAANAAPVHCLWTDSDGAQPPDWLPAPTAIVQSSPGRNYHFWRLTRPIPPAKAAELNKRIAYAMGADKSGWDLGQVLRFPDTLHGKTATRHPVQLVALDDDRTVDPDELDRLLPKLAESQQQPASDDQADDEDEPPVFLEGRDLEVWRGQRPVMKPDGDIDRSGTFFKVGAVLWNNNATAPTLRQGLLNRDAAFGWAYFTEKPADLERIIAKLRGKPRKPPDGPRPDGGHGDHTTCERTIERLKRRCERYRRFAVARGTEARHLREKARAEMALFRNQQLTAGQRMTALGLTYHVTGDESRGQADAAARTHISSTQLAELTGQSPNTVRDHIKTFAALGLCTRKVTRTQDPISDEWSSELRAGFADGGASVAERLQRFAVINLSRERKPGTGHPKPACPHCGDEAERGWICRRCNVIVDGPEVIDDPLNGNFSHSEAAGPTAPDCGEPRTYTGNFSHSGMPPNVTPLPNSRECDACGGLLHWLAAGRWVCTGCGVETGYAVVKELSALAGAAGGGD